MTFVLVKTAAAVASVLQECEGRCSKSAIPNENPIGDDSSRLFGIPAELNEGFIEENQKNSARSAQIAYQQISARAGPSHSS